MATNEELAVRIQNGEKEQLLTLWVQIRRMVLKQANRWAASGQGGAEIEDLLQCGFIAMMRSVDSFDSSAGFKFTTHMFYLLKQEFTDACGQKTQRTRRDLLQAAVSLSMPLVDDEGDSLLLEDTLPDPSAEAALEDVVNCDFEDRRRAAVETALATLPENLQKTIRAKYYQNEKVDVFAHGKALRMLRHPSRSRALREYW